MPILLLILFVVVIFRLAAGKKKPALRIPALTLAGLAAVLAVESNLDILSTFRPSERLLLDLDDAPDEVKRLTWEAHHLWHACFQEHNQVLRPINPGYSAWTPIFSESPYCILQCDFCYMISPAMFEEFVRPELADRPTITQGSLCM